MRKIGYVYNFYNKQFVEKQFIELKKAGIETFIAEENNDFEQKEKERDKKLNEIFLLLHEGDCLVIYDLSCLGKSIIQLSEFLELLRRKKIKLQILNKKMSQLSDDLYCDLIIEIAKAEKKIISERTTRGLDKARSEGRIGGRPRVSEETIERIRFLYKFRAYTLREIADECNVSLGTAYKYAQED
ncbi:MULTISPECIES: recombinase family protein [Vagococcus]|uniref:recombinase family protein n=1 Tax=Vagococcus TaxID=2737 RepID=UPI002FCB2B12